MSLVCAITIIVNLTSVWTKQDQTTLEVAQKRCAQLYADAPCLKKLIKKSDDTYNAVCSIQNREYLAWIKN